MESTLGTEEVRRERKQTDRAHPLRLCADATPVRAPGWDAPMTDRPRSGDGRTSGLRQLLTALIVALVSVAMLWGSFLLTRLDPARLPATPTRAAVLRSTSTPFLPTFTPRPRPTERPPTSVEDTIEPGENTGVATLSVTETPVTRPTECARPSGWFTYTVQNGDTLRSLAERSGTDPLDLARGNCLGETPLVPGQQVYVPRQIHATPTPEPYPCGPPLTWVVYIVQRGDTVYSLSRSYGVSRDVFRRANCLRSNAIYAGQALYVPPVTPKPSPTGSPTPEQTPSPTPEA